MMVVVYVLVGLVVLFFGFQFAVILKMRASKGKKAPELPGVMGKRIKKGERLLFYFYSPRCAACRTMTPMVEKLGHGNSRVFKIDISKDMLTARQFGVLGTPATLLVDAGSIEEFMVGAQPEARLSALLAEPSS